MKKKNRRRFVRYRVICFETGRVLAVGQKWRDISNLQCAGMSLSFFRILRYYERIAVVGGVTCLIQYWTTLRRMQCNIVVQGGVELGLRGGSYSDSDYYCENEVAI